MSKDWTPDELAAASEEMKAAGYMSYDEFCTALEEGLFTETPSLGHSGQLQLIENASDNNSIG